MKTYRIVGVQGGGSLDVALVQSEEFGLHDFYTACGWGVDAHVEYPDRVEELDDHGNVVRTGGVVCGDGVEGYGHGPKKVLWGQSGYCESQKHKTRTLA